MSDVYIPTLTHATERDIDLLLVEEFIASLAFTEWVAKNTQLKGDIQSVSVLHSKRRTRNRREIDIFVEISLRNGTRSALLIENKLDASEQLDQAESYRKELTRISADYHTAYMIICCPKAYASQHKEFVSKFDAVITYEALSEYFSNACLSGTGDMSLRMAYRRDVLLQAIHKHRRGYVPVPNKIIGDFNALYRGLLREIAPTIIAGPSMNKKASPDESTSMIYDHNASLSELPKSIRPSRFSHELGRGKKHRANYVSVVFSGWGSALTGMKEQLEKDASALGASFSAKRPTKARPNPGLVMSCPTPPVNNQDGFDNQTEKLSIGIKAALRLREWLFANQAILKNWKITIEQNVI